MKTSLETVAPEIDPERSLADLVQTVPGAARTFETLGLDYCCRGRRSLSEAAAQSSLPLAEVIARLTVAEEALPAIPSELGALCEHIVRHHHTFTREALERLGPLADKVLRVHGGTHPELRKVRELLSALTHDLGPHMAKEEQILFPYIASLAAGQSPRAPFAQLEHPLRVMEREHDDVGALLQQLADVTRGYSPPAGACASYEAFFAGLKDLQTDLHEHVHLENNVLFPAAVALKNQVDER